jgi:GMP synthase (glutamine-hydrolysing)
MAKEKIIVLDFGGQFNQLIARRVRELGVYCEVLPCDTPVGEYRDDSLRGIILTGGPQSVHEADSLACPPETFEAGVPVMGICYGMHLISHMLGGTTREAEAGEYGLTRFTARPHALFAGVEAESVVWMNHRDQVETLPVGFAPIGSTGNCPIAAFAGDAKKLYGVQFHPEVQHTVHGTRILKNFLFGICGCEGGYFAGDMIEELVREVRETVGGAPVLSALSGGVDSSVASVLVHRAVGDNLTCIFVDHGLLRKGEAGQVLRTYRDHLGLNVIAVDASRRFLDRLRGVTDPEQKRKIIGNEFIRVFEEESARVNADYLVQGTIYPDVIESGRGPSASIKSHHNVGGLPENMRFKGLIEPLRMLFKDEVRVLGESLGIDRSLVWRQPFPGPGLAVRVMGEVTEEKLRVLRESDAIVREEIEKAGLNESLWQYFAVHTGVRTVGVMGDARTYDSCIAVRAVASTDAMTAAAAEIPYPVLTKLTSRIINEVRGVNRVVYDITSKPPGTIEWE